MSHWNIRNTLKDKDDFLPILLENRGVVTDEEKSTFLNPPSIDYYIKNLNKDFLASLKAASVAIKAAINDNVPIVINGDYDSDGVCATAIIHNVLREELGYTKTLNFIPNRFKHGYGLSLKSIDTILENVSKLDPNPKYILFITVDSGITSVAETAHIKALGHKIIITDHHQKPPEMPAADVLVWNDQIVGSTIAWLLAKVLGSKDRQSLAFAGIATVTDVQPLLGFNRSIVTNALKILNTEPPTGIKALLSLCKKDESEITTYDLGWVIGPRLNASGRIEDASDALMLLIEKDYKNQLEYAQKLQDINVQRQDKTLEMYNISQNFDSSAPPKIIISTDAAYHEGIIGLVASKLVQKHYRPSIVISLEESYGKGSARSIPGINIIEVLRQFEDLFINVGGHPMAAGFTVMRENIPLLTQRLSAFMDNAFDATIYQESLQIDLEVPIALIDLPLLTELDKLKPFGVGNPEPLFLSRDLNVVGINKVGKSENHLSLRLYKDNQFYKGIMFNFEQNGDLPELVVGDNIDVVYKLKKNEYRGTAYIDLVISDFKLSA